MDSLAVILFCILVLIAGMHFYWAFGGFWPGKDEVSLARIVVGEKNISRMPSRLLTLAVVAAIFAASIWPLMWRSIIPYFLPQGLLWLGMVALALVFLGRGVVGYLPVFTDNACAQPFARLNALYFSPLCLIIGASFVMLLLYV